MKISIKCLLIFISLFSLLHVSFHCSENLGLLFSSILSHSSCDLLFLLSSYSSQDMRQHNSLHLLKIRIQVCLNVGCVRSKFCLHSKYINLILGDRKVCAQLLPHVILCWSRLLVVLNNQ